MVSAETLLAVSGVASSALATRGPAGKQTRSAVYDKQADGIDGLQYAGRTKPCTRRPFSPLYTEAIVPESFNPIRIPTMWVSQVLSREHDDVRFEAFANDVVSELEGGRVVGTSRSWDLGRDGRGLGARQGTFVLTTLRSDADKPKGDAVRLKAHARKIAKVYYVAPRIVSEAVLEAHCKEIQTILGADVVVDPLGGPQLEDLVSSGKAAEAFRRHYAGELASITAALAVESHEPEITHLELALSTFGASNTQELRDALGSRLILGLLSKDPLDVSELANGAAAILCVGAFSKSAIQRHCGVLERRGDITHDSGTGQYHITNAGQRVLEASDQQVVAGALSGRDSVRRAVEESLGRGIPEQHWSLLWTALQKELAHAFYVRGKQILDVISALLQGDASAVQRDVLAVLVDSVLTKVVANHVSEPNRPNMLRAFRDAFLPGAPHGAFDWLAGVAARFAATCTLGLPAEIASTIEDTLRRLRCFVDTDVVVSYLCAHEPSHTAAHAIIELNKRLGNKLMITDAVAEEVARHAMKAHTDYRVRVAPASGSLQWYEIAELESAFTREFEYLRNEGRVRPQDWPRFITRYTGEEIRRYRQPARPNTAKMRTLLSGESFSIRSPGEQAEAWERQRDTLAAAMYEEAKRYYRDRPDITEHKARIDAEMLITVARAIAESQADGAGERHILITSARRLRNLPAKARQQLPDVPEILSLAEAATIASLLPEQPLSLRALNALLFEGHFEKAIGRLEGLLLRIVREAASAVIPGATRGVLAEEFGAAILREAKRTGEAESEVRQRIDRDPVELAKIAAVAVDALALTRPVDREDVLRRIEASLAPRERRSNDEP